MLAELWNINENDSPWGSSITGSSEAIFLAPIAAKTRFQEQSQNQNKIPNIVLEANAHTAWYKAANYQGIEIREVPVRHGRFSVDASDIKSYIINNEYLTQLKHYISLTVICITRSAMLTLVSIAFSILL